MSDETTIVTPEPDHAKLDRIRWVENKVDNVESRLRQTMDFLTRHETRIGRTERDILELRSAATQFEDRGIQRLAGSEDVLRRIEEALARIEAKQSSLEALVRKPGLSPTE
jgi:hypothetical protein